MRNENGKYKAFVEAESNLTNQQSGEES